MSIIKKHDDKLEIKNDKLETENDKLEAENDKLEIKNDKLESNQILSSAASLVLNYIEKKNNRKKGEWIIK